MENKEDYFVRHDDDNNGKGFRVDNDEAFKYKQEKSCGQVFLKLMFSHIGLFIIVALYTVLGAKLFIHYEADAEKERYEAKKEAAQVVEDTVNYNAQLLWYYGDEKEFNWTFVEFNRTVYKDLLRMERFILESIENNNYDGTITGWTWDWTFMNSLLLSMTILTTVGYGNITPVTFEGMMFCIVYALIGCPIFLLFLANIGSSMAAGFTWVYSRICCRCCRSRRYLSELPENTSTRFKKHVIDDVVGEEEYMPTSKVFVPITINIVILHIYFLLGGLLFAAWEYWDTLSAVYFSFVTLSTIGYGDYVPGNSLADNPDSIITTMKLLIAVFYILFGMGLLSMCINLMQQQLVEKCQWVGRKVGLVKSDNEVSEPVPMDRRKDSLMPLMEESKGTSPFRHSDGEFDEVKKESEIKGENNLPGILEDGN
ncbi:UNVERIFIED_CONTAM: hypothetical protein RMT77_000592 [Armadillidium vulgare]